MSHLDEGVLHALLDGEIPSPELGPIQAHLAGCSECRARLEEERALLADAAGLVDVLEVPAGEAGSPSIPWRAPARQRRSWVYALAWAATVVAAVGVGYQLRGSGFAQQATPAEPLATAPAAESTQTLNATATAPPAERASSGAARNAAPERPRRNEPAELAKLERKTADRLETAPPALKTRADTAAALRDAAPATVAAAPPPPAPPSSAGLRSATGAFRAQPLERNQAQLAASPEALLAPPEPIGLPDAIRRLGGSIRLIDGLVPARLEAQGATVRVVYSLAQGELVLSQQLSDGRLQFTLVAPPGFAPDSLAKLRARVRD